MEFFFQQYYLMHANEVNARMPASDSAKLTAFAQEQGGRRQQTSVRHMREKEKICTRIDSLSAEAIAAEIEQMDASYAADNSSEYQTFMNSLSADGRNILGIILAKEITPNLVYSEVDIVGLWGEYPRFLLEQLKFICSTDPADLQMLTNQALEAAGQTNQSSSSSSTFGTLPE